MARSVRKAWNRKDTPGNDDELRKQATEAVKEKNEAAFQHLVHLQGREVKALESERAWVEKEKARDVSPINTKEIAGINQRYDRRAHELQRKHDNFFGKLHRVFGGHKHQQRRMNALNGDRDREVGERTKQHVEREGQRQRSLTERDVRVEKDIGEAKERHAVDRDEFRQQRERSFEMSVKHEMNRLRLRGPSMGM